VFESIDSAQGGDSGDLHLLVMQIAHLLLWGGQETHARSEMKFRIAMCTKSVSKTIFFETRCLWDTTASLY
jgi:hypothetical protein